MNLIENRCVSYSTIYKKVAFFFFFVTWLSLKWIDLVWKKRMFKYYVWYCILLVINMHRKKEYTLNGNDFLWVVGFIEIFIFLF